MLRERPELFPNFLTSYAISQLPSEPVTYQIEKGYTNHASFFSYLWTYLSESKSCRMSCIYSNYRAVSYFRQKLLYVTTYRSQRGFIVASSNSENRTESEIPSEKVCLIMGAGDSIGGAIAKKFAKEGYIAAVARRHKHLLMPLVSEIASFGGSCIPYGCDSRNEAQVQEMFQHVESEVGPIDVCVFNVGANITFPIRETSCKISLSYKEMSYTR